MVNNYHPNHFLFFWYLQKWKQLALWVGDVHQDTFWKKYFFSNVWRKNTRHRWLEKMKISLDFAPQNLFFPKHHHLYLSQSRHLRKRIFALNIARGTTDPGYWVLNFSNLSAKKNSNWYQSETSSQAEDNFFSLDKYLSLDNFLFTG